MSYSLFVIFCGASLWGASGLLTLFDAAILLGFLALSIGLYKILVILFGDVLVGRIRLSYVNSARFQTWSLLGVLVFGAMIGITSAQQGGFNIATSYVRRLAGRENFQAGAITTYIFTMVLNGVTPFLAFLGIYKRKYWLVVVSILFAIYAYWLIGTKAPVLMVGVMGAAGWFFYRSSAPNFSVRLLLLILMVLVLALMEYTISGYSYLADYFIRRAFAVVAQIQAAYFDYALNHFNLINWLIGNGDQHGISISMYIGDWYFGDPNTNANTDTLLYSLLQNGIVGWMVAIAFIAGAYSILDNLFKKRGIVEAIGIGLLYAVLLAEQAYSTAFLSSGIGLLTLVYIFVGHRHKDGETLVRGAVIGT